MRIILSILFIISFMSCKKTNEDVSNKLEKENKRIELNYSNNQEKFTEQSENLGKDNSNSSIPINLRKYINENLNNLRTPKIEEYVKDWEKFYSGKSDPFICSSDFDGNGFKDIALLLVDENKKKLYLYIFNKSMDDYTPYLIGSYNKEYAGIQIVLSVEEKGEWEAIDEIIIVENDGVVVDFIIESITKTYYWKDSKYMEFIAD